MTASSTSDGRHPWLAKFENAPEEAFGDLLAGYADIAPYERADPPDAARMLFSRLRESDPARQALGRAILSWLNLQRTESLLLAEGKLQRRVREICEAFEIVALLRVTEAATELRRNFLAWNDWVSNLSLSTARDARAEYWRMLALTQPISQDAQGIDDWGLGPLWQLVCRESGGRFPAHYLDIGLLGLRYLPDHSRGSEVPWLSGLANWALARNPSPEEFKAAWFAVKPLYPRAPHRWRKLVGNMLSTRNFADAGVHAPAWWDVDNDFAPMQKEKPAGSAALHSPFPEDCARVIELFSRPFAMVEPRIDQLLSDHRRYLHATGNSDFIVRAIHSLGKALIARGGDEPHRRFLKAQALAREGLSWTPNDMYLWSLWFEALAADGSLEAAEMIGWEAIRRFPQDPDSRNALAELLIAQDRISEAAAVVDELFERNIADSATNAIRARLYSNEGRLEEAAAAIDNGLHLNPSDTALRTLKEVLAKKGTLPLKSLTYRGILAREKTVDKQVELDPTFEYVWSFGRVRRIRTLLNSQIQTIREDATENLRRLLLDEPTFAYSRLLAARLRIWQEDDVSRPSFSVAFENALAAEDHAKFMELAKREKPLEALTLVARAVLGDANATQSVDAWLRRPENPGEEHAVALLRGGLRPLFTLIQGGRSASEVFVHERDVAIRALHDANEAVLGSLMLAA